MSEPATVEKIPHGTEELRRDLHDVVARYPELTIAATIGTLEIVKQDMIQVMMTGHR